MKTFSGSLKLFLITCFSLLSFVSFSQVDNEFWFSMPYVTKNHGIDIQANENVSLENMGGGSPVYLRLSTLSTPAVVTINTPADMTIIDTVITIAANSTATINLTKYISKLEISQTYSTIINGPESKGIHIVSNSNITAYYENATIPNPEIFTLKGKNALGTEFYAPLQTRWPNDPIHNYRVKTVYSKVGGWHSLGYSTVPDSAFSAIDIVATTDGTIVTITPTTDIVGHKKGETFKVVLAKAGMTYSIRQLNQAITDTLGMTEDPITKEVAYKTVISNRDVNNLSGTHISSNHPVTVSVKDDSLFPNDVAESSGKCEDYIGDQIIPVSVIGKEYVVMKGALAKTTINGELTDYVFLLGVKDGTKVTIDGGAPVTINKSQTLEIPVTNSVMYIKATDSIYAYHVSGYVCELASAVLPPINECTGSNEVGFVRTYGTYNDEKFYINVLVRTGGEGSFAGDAIADKINKTNFIDVNPTWKAAQIEFTNAELPIGPHKLTNTKTYFHIGLIYSTVYAWDSVWNDASSNPDQVPSLQGASYGYFSSFNKVNPRAIIANNNKKQIQVPQGMPVQLYAEGGFMYNWKGYKETGSTWTALTSPYYLDKLTGSNPVFSSSAPIGKYMYAAEITPACDNMYVDTIYVEVIPKILFHDVTDSICENTPGSGIGSGYDLNNLNDTIVGVKGKSLGYTVSEWMTAKDFSILDDAESNKVISYSNTVNSTLSEKVANTLISTVNGSSTVNAIAGNNPSYSTIMNFPEGLKLTNDIEISMLVRPIFGNPGWEKGMSPFSVKLDLTDGTNDVSSTQTFTSTNWLANTWQLMTFTFPANSSATTYNSLRLNFGDNSNWAPMTFQFDDVNILTANNLNKTLWNSSDFYQSISNATNYTIHDNDTVYALIKNPQFPYFSDTAKVVLGVQASGRNPKNVTLPVMCATSGSVKKCVDLTQYKYEVGGALVAQKEWYSDAPMKQLITTPTCVNIIGNATFYAKINDACDNKGSITFNIKSVPTVTDSVVKLCANPALQGNKANGIKLDNYNDYILPISGPTPEWYSDPSCSAASRISGAAAITVSDGQKFYAKVFENEECYALAELTFEIKPLASISMPLNDVCLNSGNVQLSATPVGGTFSGDGITGFTFNPVTAGVGIHHVTYTYSYTTSGMTCQNIATDSIEVFAVPSANAVSVPVSPVDYNTSVQLQSNPSGGKAGYTFSWSPAAKVSNSTLQNPTSVSLTTAEQFCVTVTDVNQCKATSCVNVSVKDAPLNVVITSPIANNICLGQTVDLNSLISGGKEPYTISWSSNPSGLTGSNATASHTPSTTGNITYTISVTDGEGTKVSASKTINVLSNPVIVFANQTPSVCQNGTLKLSPNITGTDAGTTYQWSGAPAISAPLTGASVNVDASVLSGSYPVSLTVTNSLGCKDVENISLKINENPKASIDEIPGACLGVAIPLNANPSGGTIPYAHKWTSNFVNGDLINPTDEDPTFKSNTYAVHNLTYTVTDKNGCTASAQTHFELNVLPDPNITLKHKDSICQNTNSYLLDVTIDNESLYTYSWTGTEGNKPFTSNQLTPILDVSEPKTFDLHLKVTDKKGCSAYDSVLLAVNPSPTAQIIGDATICQGLNLPLQSFEKSNNNTYTWTSAYVSPKTGTSVTFSSSVITNHTVGLEVKNKITGCVANATKTVTVKSIPVVTLRDTSVCLTSSFNLKPTVSSTSVMATWKIDTLTLNGAHILNPKFLAAESRDYVLALQVDEAGCSGIDTMVVHVRSNPVANAGNQKTELNSVPFTLDGSASTGANPLQFKWSPATFITSSSIIANPTAVITDPQMFTLTVTDNFGCSSTDSVFINIKNDRPKVVVSSIYICDTKTVSLTAQASGGTGADYTYRWFQLPSNTELGITSETLNVNVSKTTSFVVEMTNSPYAAVYATATVTVHALPTATVTPPEPMKVCMGESLTLQASSSNPAVTYEWKDNVLTTPGALYVFNNSTTSGISNVVLNIKDQYCTAEKVYEITVNAKPTVSITPDNQTMCAGTNILFTATPSTSPNGYNYAWTQLPSTAIIGTSSTYGFSRPDAGAYNLQVQVTDKGTGCKATDMELITVNAMPDFRLPKDTIGCTNQALTLDLNPKDAPVNLTVTWSGDTQYFINTTNPTSPTFKTSVANSNGYKLRYRIDDGKGCPRIDSIYAHIYSVPTLSLRDTAICVGESAILEAGVVGSVESLVWGDNVVPLTNTPTFARFVPNYPGKYPVKISAATNEFCKSEATATVTINANPVSFIPLNYPNTPKGGQETMVGEAMKGFGKAPYTGKWLPPDLIQSEIAGSNGFIAKTYSLVSEANNFALVTTDANGCKDTAHVVVNVKSGIEIEVIGDPNNKPADPNNPIDPSAYPSNSLVYFNDDICLHDSYTLLSHFKNSGNGDYTYRWTANNDPSFVATTANVVVSPTKNTIYTLHTTDKNYPNAFIQEQSFELIVHGLPEAHIASDYDLNGSLYASKEITLKGDPRKGKAPYTYFWSGKSAYALDKTQGQFVTFNGVTAGSYDLTLTVIDAYGCKDSINKPLTILPVEDIAINGKMIVCGNGETSTYEVLNPEPDGVYYWTLDDRSIPLKGKNPGLFVGINWNKPGTYKLTVNNMGSGKPQNPKTITIIVYPELDLSKIVGPHDVCEYEKATYSVDTTNSNSITNFYAWSVASGIPATPSNGTSTMVQWGSAGTDFVLIKGNNVCRDQSKYPVTIHKTPVPDFYARSMDSAKTKDIYSYKLVDFDNRSYLYSPVEIDNKNLHYYWDFVGDGVYVDESFEPVYSYDQKGTFNASLIAVDPIWGCRDTIRKPVNVVENPNCSIKYPNAFTPEAKTDKSFGYGYSEGLVDDGFNLKIFNRWGQLLWETNSRIEKWDGTYKGEICKQDVYVYHSTATCENGKVLKVNGDVTLIK